MKLMAILFILIPQLSSAACQDMVRAYWRFSPQKKTLELVNFAPKAIEFCQPLVHDTSANVVMKIEANSKLFSRPLFIPFYDHWDSLSGDELQGGAPLAADIYFDSPIPLWAKKSKLKLISLETNEEIGSGEMK
jgi:hypothetical protein